MFLDFRKVTFNIIKNLKLSLNLAFYVIYEFGKSTTNSLYDSPIEAIFDLITMSLRDLGFAYVNLLTTKYHVIGRVIIKKI